MASKRATSSESPFVVSDRGRSYIARRKLTAKDIFDQAHAIATSRFKRYQPIKDPDAVNNFLIAQIGEHDREIFAVVFLNNQHRVIAFEKLFYGTVNETRVYPREVARRALYHNAAAIILAHNHPSGDPSPSPADETLTEGMRDALRIFDIRVLDHVVVGAGDAVSIQEMQDDRRDAEMLARRHARRRRKS